jgi:predicted DNA-binding protein (MmcQ/YjbR family)
MFSEYDEHIQPGFMSKTHWNTIALNESVSDALVKELIDHSYELILKVCLKNST